MLNTGLCLLRDREDFTLAPESSFYKSVHYVDNVPGPARDIICGVESEGDHNNQCMKSREYAGYRAEKVPSIVSTGCFLDN